MASAYSVRELLHERVDVETDPVTAWAQAVLAGEVVQGPHVRNACRRHLQDLRDGPARGLTWDLAAAMRAITFGPKVCRLNGGQFEGRPFKLQPSQAFKTGSLFGWKRADGTRRFRRAYIEEGKGNGKSPWAAMTGMYGLTADGEKRAEIYAAASKKDQAFVLFRDAVAMVDLSPRLAAGVAKSGLNPVWNLAHGKSSSFMRPISSEDGQSGPRPHFALCDEVHEHKDGRVLEMLERGFKFRRQPLLVMITNSGTDRNSVCWEEHQHAVRVAAGTREPDAAFAYVGEGLGDSAFSFVCALDPSDDPLTDPSCWPKANPLLDVTITTEYLAGVVDQARQMPGKLNGILRLHFCVWTDAEKAWMGREPLEAVLADFDPAEEHEGRSVFSISGTTRSGWDFVDELGSVLARIDENGLTVGVLNVLQSLAISGVLSAGSLDLSSVTISSYPDPNVALVLTDPAGWVIFAVLTNGKVLCAGVTTPASSGDYTADELAERNARAVALSAGYRGILDTTSTAAIWAYNHALVYGQSLGAGVEGWPAKTLVGRSDVLMVGQSVRPGGNNAATSPTPLGDSAFRPAIATAQDASSGALLSASQQAALAAGDPSLGEEIGVAAMLFARRLFLQRAGVMAADDRRFVVSNVAVGGKSVEELSKGYSTEYFNRLRVMATAAKNAATAAGGSYGVCAGFWLQGEWNYAGTNGATDKASYKTNAKKVRTDFNADIATTIAGQADMPDWITYQTGGQYTVDATDMSIGQAQWELSQENNGWYLAAPSYPYTDKNGHLDPNGYRWLAMQMGKVFHETVILRRRWKPLSPIQATVRGQTVVVDFHLPSGTPLQFQPVYVQSVATTFSDRGFTVIDDSGTITLTGVSIVGDACVKISLGRAPVGTVKVYYARKTTFNGHGNLCDSDPTVAPFAYEYTAGSGDYAAANIAGLVGSPYPLWNWCIAFVLTATPN